jgi:pimeloyl-ACP methyl ester carboxylesterase
MRRRYRIAAIGLLSLGMMLALGSSSGIAESRPHVYLLRGLMNIFSLGMDTLGEELNKRGVYATVHNHTEWQQLADQAATDYRAGKEGPIILIGHSLGANAVMEMAAYLGKKGVPVALVVPFDAAGSYFAASNVARVVNLTQRNYAYMQRGPGFHGTLANVDVSSDPNIDHFNIDKSARLHERVISEVLAVVGGHGGAASGVAMPVPAGVPAGNRAIGTSPALFGEGSTRPKATPAAPAAPTAAAQPMTDTVTPIVAIPERPGPPASSGPAMPPPSQHTTASQIAD